MIIGFPRRVNLVGKHTVGRVHRCFPNTDTVPAECKVAKHPLHRTGEALLGADAVLTISGGLVQIDR